MLLTASNVISKLSESSINRTALDQYMIELYEKDEYTSYLFGVLGELNYISSNTTNDEIREIATNTYNNLYDSLKKEYPEIMGSDLLDYIDKRFNRISYQP